MIAGQCLYGGTKAMLDRVTTGAASELYGDNIAVNALAPEAQSPRKARSPLRASIRRSPSR
jgi:NAD(P)-dependent dehydrogenase (short-subunit alcohol dehydrogenase family)